MKQLWLKEDRKSFVFLAKEMNSRVNDLLNQINAKNNEESDERDHIWAEYTKNMSEIEKNLNIINYFVYLKDDEFINEFPIESIHVLQDAVKAVENSMSRNKYTDDELFRYRNCLDEGYRVLNVDFIKTD